MSSSWCKVASNLDSHPKIRRAGRNGREVFLFALRRNAEPNNRRRGFVAKEQLEPWYIADQLQMPEDDAANGLESAQRAGLLREEPDAWAIVGWDDREWGRFAKDGAERTADWRKRKAANAGDDSVTVRDGGDGCDGIEEIRGEEKREEVPPPAPKIRKPKTALPKGWIPERSEANTNAEEIAKLRGVDLRTELQKLRDWASAENARKADWEATWRNWTRNAKPANGAAYHRQPEQPRNIEEL